MVKARTTISIAVVGALAAASLWAGGQLVGDSDEAAGTDRLVNQVWIERMPADGRDMVAHVVLLEHPQGKLGVTGRSSTWRHFNEIFLWRLRGNELDTKFPQDRVKGSVRVRTWECEGEAPEPFELCLEIGHGGRTAVLYSRLDWVVRPHERAGNVDLAAEYPEIAEVLAQLPAEAAVAAADFDAVEDAESWSESASMLVE